MQKVANFAKQYMGVALVVLGICILLSYSFSSFIVSSDNHRAAEMYMEQLKYTIKLDKLSEDLEYQNSYWVPSGESIADVVITNENAVDTYFKLFYKSNPNLEISYYESTTDTDDTVTSYSSPNGFLKSKGAIVLKLKIVNVSSSIKALELKVSGGYSTNTLADIEVPSTYTEITKVETPSSNTYFCKTDDTLTQGLVYENGQYKYSYSSYTTGWSTILADKTSTDSVTSKLCTYVNNKPIKSLYNMFSNSAATTIDVSGFNTSNVTNMQETFSNSSATEIKGLENFDTSNVITMLEMFRNTKAKVLDVSNFDTSNVESMSGMFNTIATTEIKGLENFDTSKVSSMSSMFKAYQGSTLSLNNFNTRKVTDMSNMFEGCSNLEIIYTSDKFVTDNVRISSAMFTNTNNILGGAGTIYDSNNVDYTYAHVDSKDNPGYFSDYRYKVTLCTTDTTIADKAKITIGSYTYTYKTSLNGFEVELVHSKIDSRNPIAEISCTFINKIPIVSMKSMFEESTATSIDISGINTSNVTDMSGMFASTSATEIKGLENFNTSNVTDMMEMFSRSNITTLDISSFDTSNVTNMNNMFYRTSNLTKIYVSSLFVTNNVTSSSKMFEGATKLVGGNGTAYNASYLDKTYARIDKSGTPGYFTEKSS